MRLTCLVAVALLLAACGREADDRPASERVVAAALEAPEEFAVLPQKPIEVPEDLDTLPPPRPGTQSRVDLDPQADALAALGGRRAAPAGQDRALLAAVGPARPDIRAVLAGEDAIWRERNRGRLIPRLLGRVTEAVVYARQRLDAAAELRRLRAAGVEVPQMPPPG